MLYTDTRDNTTRLHAHDVILRGIAESGGLYVPTETPHLDVRELTDLSYAERAKRVFRLYLDDFSDDEISYIADGAYGDDSRFDSEGPAPLASVGNDFYVMELFHGPTLAFKDIALQAMPRMLPISAKKSGIKDGVLILVATSGDTGKAALEGFMDVPDTHIVVFYPNGGVSRAQYLQMATQGGKNTTVVAVNGNFDDCQSGVKRLFTNDDFVKQIASKGWRFSSANSINFGRLLPQITYYFSAYADLLKNSRIEYGEKLDFVVPTGNFGDIMAGELARMMGLPVGTLVCASNSNDVLVDFFNTGRYDKRREFKKTMSPSMDILVSSNLERLISMRSGYDSAYTKKLMDELSGDGVYSCGELFDSIREGFDAGRASEEETLDAIGRVWCEYSYLMDPHTAVGRAVYEKRLASGAEKHKTVLLSTASPYKFTAPVLHALGIDAPEDMFGQAELLQSATGMEIPEQLMKLKNAPIRHTRVADPENMGREVLSIPDRSTEV